MTLTATEVQVEKVAALLARATQLVDAGDAFGQDRAATMKLATLNMSVWALTNAPIDPAHIMGEASAFASVGDCLQEAGRAAATWELGELGPEGTQFMLELHDLSKR